MQSTGTLKMPFKSKLQSFASQKALLNIPGKPGGVNPNYRYPCETLDEVLTQNGLSVDGNNITRISLQRRW